MITFAGTARLVAQPKLIAKNDWQIAAGSLWWKFQDRKAEGGKASSFADFSFIGKRAQLLSEQPKGKELFFSGEIVLQRWKDKSGEERQKLFLRAKEWEFVGPAPEKKETHPIEAMADPPEDDIPF